MNAFSHRFFACFLLLACVSACFAAPPVKSSKIVASKVAQPKTVADYFLLLPNKYFEGPTLTERRKDLADERTILDIKNDYLYLPGGTRRARCA